MQLILRLRSSVLASNTEVARVAIAESPVLIDPYAEICARVCGA